MSASNAELIPPQSSVHTSGSSVSLSERMRYWALAVGQFASIQLIIQFIGFGAGVYVVRSMTQREYGFYTIANSMQGTMSLLADVGVGSAVLAMGGRVWQDRHLLGCVIRTGLQLRYRLAIGAVLFAAPCMIYLLISQGASYLYSFLLLAVVLFGLAFQLTSNVLAVLPRLHAQVKRVQYLDLTSSIVRAGLLCAACFILARSVNSIVALLATVPSAFIQFFVLKRWANEMVDPAAEASSEYRTEMLGVVRSLAPNAIFYCFQGQIAVWLIGTFGKVEKVAEVGALGRLGVIFTIVSSVMATMVIPRFARCQDVAVLRRRYLQIVGACGAIALLLVTGAGLLTNQFLWLLGKQYSHLHSEFLLMVLCSVASFVMTTLWSLNTAKAWVQYSWLYIPITLGSDLLAIPFLNLSTVRGVLIFSGFPQIPLICLQFFLTYMGLRKEAAARASSTAA